MFSVRCRLKQQMALDVCVGHYKSGSCLFAWCTTVSRIHGTSTENIFKMCIKYEQNSQANNHYKNIREVCFL